MPERRVSRKLACIIGWPVAHSLSPAIHNAAFSALGLDWTYVPLAVRPGGIAEGINVLRLLEVEGANVTMPHKRDVVPLLDRLEGDAIQLDAVNTIVRDGPALVGHNTDGPGFLAALRVDADFEPAGARALILGAGGAARAVALALARGGATVTVAARRPGQAAGLAALAAGIAAAPWPGEPGWIPGAADLVVNATPLRDGLPLEHLGLGSGVLAADLIYSPPVTPFVLFARERGARAVDGLGMLVQQAALSFRLWTGIDAPLDVMAEAARRAAAAPDAG
ncbi:MAG: shikimate dehydrogenase [Actinomycetota bacterium]